MLSKCFNLILMSRIVAAQIVRAKRSSADNAPWNDGIVIPPNGAQSCSTWKNIAVPCLAILSLEIIGAIIALVVCCKCRRGG